MTATLAAVPPTTQSTEALVVPGGIVSYIHVVVGFATNEGRKEVVRTIDANEVTVAAFMLNHEQKMGKAKDENGDFIGFEPTGEEVLTLKVKYVRG